MKTIFKNLGIIFLVSLLFMACQSKINELQNKNEELAQQLEERDSTLNQYLETISEVEDNLAAIKEKQNVIDANTTGNVELTGDTRTNLVNDLNAINQLMEENKAKIASLQKMIKNSHIQVSEFKNMLAKLNKKIIEKDEEITALNSKVEELNFKNQTLADNITFLNVKVDTLAAVNKQQREKISDQEKLIAHNMAELSAGFVATGTTKELEEKHIITKEGGFLGIGSITKLNEDASRENFQKIDITKTMTIPLMVKKARLITDHPVDSYKLEHSAKGDLFSNLVITDPKKFWNTSKFLVVRVN